MAGHNKRQYGSPAGFLLTVAIGFAFYVMLPLIPSMGITYFAYKNIIDSIGSDASKQFLWFMINWTEADFTAGVFSSAMVIVGGAIAWQLAVRGSVKRGFPICYGSSHTWPWVLAAQVGALLTNMYLFGYLFLLGRDGVSWVATFIVLVSVPSALMLTYGPTVPTLLTAIILPASMAAPISYWLSKTLLPMLKIPGGICNVLSMALSGFAVMAVCRVLPWIKKVEPKPIPESGAKEDVFSPVWAVRRAFAEFSEPHFYGNEIVGACILGGAVIDWIINKEHGLSGLAGEYLPAILLAQFIAAGVGIFLYARKFDNGGWYGTYVPVVSSAPWCVLAFGAELPKVIFIAVLSGILGAPVASSLGEKLPEGIHIFVANVMAMAITTAIVWAVMDMMPWF